MEEDPDAARDKRDRVWRMADPDGIRFRTEEMLAQPGGKAAYTVFRRSAVEWGRHLVDRAFAAPPPGERSNRSIAEYALRLTRDEAEELAAELDGVITRWRDGAVARGRDEESDDRQTYSVFQLVQPYPGLPDPPDES